MPCTRNIRAHFVYDKPTTTPPLTLTKTDSLIFLVLATSLLALVAGFRNAFTQLDLELIETFIAILIRVRYRLTPPPAPPRVGEGSKSPVPPSLAGKGARGLGLGVPHLSENRYITQICELNEPLANAIATLANNFQYEQLLNLIQISGRGK